MAAYEGRLIRCMSCGAIMDRDVVAVLNLQMWGAGAYYESVLDKFVEEMIYS